MLAVIVLYVLFFNMKDVCFSKYTPAVSKKELSKQFILPLSPKGGLPVLYFLLCFLLTKPKIFQFIKLSPSPPSGDLPAGQAGLGGLK